MRPFLFFLFTLILAGIIHSGGSDRSMYLSTKEEILRLSVERIRSAGSDYERVLVTAENRLRDLHDGGTSPTSFEDDVNELRTSCLKMQRLVRVGRAPDSDPIARHIIDRHWETYRQEIDVLSRQILDKKGDVSVESRLFWETIHAFNDLKDRTRALMLFNTPRGERGLEEAMNRDEAKLLKACEITPKKTRGKNIHVVAPRDVETMGKPDIQAFYRSLDLVPDARPLRSGSLTIPPHSRTVTVRDDKSRMVFRPIKGVGVAYLGQTETDLRYGYVAVSPDTAYYFENTGHEPLILEYVGIKP